MGINSGIHSGIEALLTRLDRVKPAGRNRWRSRCPAHGGDNPNSLSIFETDDGRVLLYCHAHQCSAAAIIEATGLDMSDLFPTKPIPLQGRGRAPPAKAPWRAGEVARALEHELAVIYVLLGSIAHERPFAPADRARAGEAQERLTMFMKELRNVT